MLDFKKWSVKLKHMIHSIHLSKKNQKIEKKIMKMEKIKKPQTCARFFMKFKTLYFSMNLRRLKTIIRWEPMPKFL